MANMLFYHVTHQDNLASIQKEGLLLSKAFNQKHPFIWLDAYPCMRLRDHIARKHNWDLKDLVTLEVTFNRDFCITHLLPHCFHGIAYKTKRDIPAANIKVFSTSMNILY